LKTRETAANTRIYVRYTPLARDIEENGYMGV